MEKTFYSILVAKPSDAKEIVDFFNARGKKTSIYDVMHFVTLSSTFHFVTPSFPRAQPSLLLNVI